MARHFFATGAPNRFYINSGLGVERRLRKLAEVREKFNLPKRGILNKFSGLFKRGK